MDSSFSSRATKNSKLSVRNQTQFKKSSNNMPASKKNNNLCMREQTLFKKAFELSTLCDVELCVLYYGRDGELIKTWPEDQTKVRDMAERFSKLSEGEKRKKSSNLSQFLNKKISDGKKHDDDNKLSDKLFEMEASLESRLRVFQEKLRLLSAPHDHQREPCAASSSTDPSPSLIVDNHQQKTEEPIANHLEQDQRQSLAVYSGFPIPTDLSKSSSSSSLINHPPNCSILLYNHVNRTFTQLPSTFHQPAMIPQNLDQGYSDSLLGGQRFGNIELPPLMQIESPPVQSDQNASWNHGFGYSDLLLEGQGIDGMGSCSNNQLPPMMQTQNPVFQFGNASWNQTTSFGDPMMFASYN
ncbi:unnamed protein product [Microthlaspi erraticum]|uniref:MADS-box domain-containing protein n=1 Tax=Microthlaspi erraticum TaxID=1685480 RepID=A0A6D2INP3_9BRAS|nr:unnamed protein product [Microthlaspi erraticum]